MKPLDRRQFVLGSGAAATAAQASSQTRRRYRNILLLIADDHSPIAGCYGNPVIRTPNMGAALDRGYPASLGRRAIRH